MPEEWDDEPAEEEQGPDWDKVKRVALACGAASVLVVGWLIAARPSDERPSMAGFSVGAGGTVAPASKALFERRKGTGLDQVYIGTMGEAPSSEAIAAGGGAGSAAAASAPASSGVAHAAEAPAPASPPAPAAPPPPSADAADEKELAAAGVPTDARGLGRLGGEPGLLSSLAARLLDHPRVLKAVFNNKLVVDAFMNRAISRRNCSSGGELKKYLSDPNSAGMRAVFPVVQQAIGKPDAAAALAGTEMGARLMDCPSVKQLGEDPKAFAEIAMSNPKALGLLTDPRAAMALAGNPRASGLLAQATSSLGAR